MTGENRREKLELAVAPEPEVEPRRGRRFGCSVLAFAVVVLLVFAREAYNPAAAEAEFQSRIQAAKQLTAEGRLGSGSTLLALDAGQGQIPVAPTPTGSVGTVLLGGWISWADPDLGGDYLATRFPRGTLVKLCTPNRCIVRRSNDFGPSAAIDPPRIADLAVLDWEQLCGLPRARGVCRGTVEAIDDLALPPTDMEDAP